MMKTFALCLVTALLISLSQPPAYAADTTAVPAPKPYAVGKATVTVLQDMFGEMALGIFSGAPEEKMKALVPGGKTQAGVMVFLVETGGKKLLVDTGYGLNTPERKSALPELLSRLGLTPESIDLVLLTHMHGDHIGGLLKDGKPAFPKAEIVVAKQELDFWVNPASREKFPKAARTMDAAVAVRDAYGSRVRVFAYGDTVAPGVTGVAAVGHTPGHTMFILESDGARMFFWGDLVHAAALQFALPEACAVYDMDMPRSVKTRIEIMTRAAEEKTPVAGAHLPFPSIGTVEKKDGAFAFNPMK